MSADKDVLSNMFSSFVSRKNRACSPVPPAPLVPLSQLTQHRSSNSTNYYSHHQYQCHYPYPEQHQQHRPQLIAKHVKSHSNNSRSRTSHVSSSRGSNSQNLPSFNSSATPAAPVRHRSVLNHNYSSRSSPTPKKITRNINTSTSNHDFSTTNPPHLLSTLEFAATRPQQHPETNNTAATNSSVHGGRGSAGSVEAIATDSTAVATPFHCDKCSKAFRQRSQLSRHFLRVHERKKPFSCAHCEKNFASAFDRKRHVEAVHGRRCIEFFCDRCSFRSKHEHELEKHIRTVHERDQCRLCGKMFKRAANLVAHERHYHSKQQQSQTN